MDKTKLKEKLNYILFNLKEDIDKVNSLEDKVYFELSKEEIIKMININYSRLYNWKNYIDIGDYDSMIKEYKDIEGDISELELCLVDEEINLHIEGICFTLLEIGSMLCSINKTR